MEIPFVYSYVEYHKGDHLGFLCALTGLFPVVVLTSLLTLIASRRDLATCAFLLGLFLCEGVNHVLKYTVKAPRPYPTLHPAFNSQSPYAWPSDHSQFSFFCAIYTCLWAPRHWSVGKVWRGTVGALGLAVAAVVGFGRVYLGYHTASQVAAGACTGALCAIAWFAAVERGLRPCFPKLASTSLAKRLWIRDLTHVKNVMKVEWEACCGKALGCGENSSDV